MAHDPAAVDWLQQDAAHRQQAIDPHGNFIVEAPAGAGKTELLTQRFLALLARVDEPEEIVALTFTHKAAAEMRQRILDNLQQAWRGSPPAEAHRQQTYALAQSALARDQARGWGLLTQSTRLQVTTLDALCGRLARQMPLLSRLGSQPAIATDALPFYTQAAQDTLRALEMEEPLADVLERVLAAMDHDTAQLQALLVRMLANRDQWLRHARSGVDLGRAEAALQALIAEELAAASAALTPALQQALMPAARHAAEIAAAVTPPTPESAALALLADWQAPLQASAADLPRWRSVCELLLTQKGEVRARPPNGFAWSSAAGKGPAEGFKAVLEALRQDPRAAQIKRLRSLPDPVYDAAEEALIADLMAVLKHATARLWLAFQAAGQVDFTQMAQNALLALGEADAPTDLQLQLDHRLSHLLVDEFQDTSPTQVDLLVRLTAGWQAGDGRTLFLVGDPMQSIYRFRKADVGLFIQARDQGLGPWRLTPLQLYRNNRSHPEVVNWVNAVFPQVFSPVDDFHRGAVRFVPAQATRPPLPQAGVHLHALRADASDQARADTDTEAADEANPGRSASADEREALCVLQQLTQALQDDPGGSVAVLVRARKHLRPLVAALRRHRPDLRVQAVEIEPLAQRQVIQDLLALTRALHQRADRVHWLAVLRAPWCGLTLADLHALVADDTRRTVWALMHDEARLQRLSSDGQARLTHVRALLGEALAHAGRQRPRRWVEGTWQALGGPLCLRGAADLADVQALWQVLDRLDQHGRLDLARLPAELEALYATPDPQASGQVQVMTIHKSKGLEFDTVILPGLHRKTSQPERPLLLWDEVIGPDGEEDLVVAAWPAPARAGQGPGKFRYLQAFEAERAAHEARRLLYVAVTRARRQLHLVAVLALKDGTPAQPAADSLLGLLWPALAPAWTAALPADNPPEASGDSASPASPPADARLPLARYAHRLERLREPAVPAPLRSPAAPDAALLASAAARHAADEDRLLPNDPGLGDGARLATDTGVLVHRLLERVGRDGLAQWPPARLQALAPALQQWLQGQGHGPEAAAQGAAEALLHLQGTCSSADGHWVLDDHPDAACELALGNAGADGVQQLVIDRTFVHQGVRWIIDYKTGALQCPADADDATLRHALAQHLPQLQRYRQLWPDHEAVRLAVFVTRWGRLVTLDPTGPTTP